MRSVFVLPSYEFYATYSGTRHLLQRMHARGIELNVLLRVDPKNIDKYDFLSYPVHFFSWWNPQWPWLFRRLSNIVFSLLIIKKLIFVECVLVIDSLYLQEIKFVKFFRKRLKIIQFCQELQLVSDYPDARCARLYDKFAHLADLVLDVDPLRAQKRMEFCNLRKMPLVLRNTLPQAEIEAKQKLSLQDLAELYSFNSLPIVIYAGGIGKEKPFSRLVDAVANMKTPVFFLAFCTTVPKVLNDAQIYAKTKLSAGSFKICSGVARNILLSVLHEADVGIVDYPYSQEQTLNQKYCAPTKLYEYMAAGLAVVGSNNETLRSVIEKHNCGVCADSDRVESLSLALEKVVSNPQKLIKMKKNAKDVFYNELSYDVCCYPVIEEMFTYICS